jgi:outer membrane protein TolC
MTARQAQEQAHGTALIAAATLAFATGKLSSSDAVEAGRR